MSHRLKTTGFDPSLGLLINHLPRRQVMRHHPPHSTHLHQIPQRIEYLAQGVDPLWGTFAHQREIADTKRPFFIADITRITFSSSVHPKLNAGMYLLCTDFIYKKL